MGNLPDDFLSHPDVKEVIDDAVEVGTKFISEMDYHGDDFPKYFSTMISHLFAAAALNGQTDFSLYLYTLIFTVPPGGDEVLSEVRKQLEAIRDA